MKMLLILLFIHVAASIPAYRANCNLDKIQISGGSYSVNEDGNVVTYSCPSGMYPHPGTIRECLSYGWTKQNAKFVCKNIRCPSPAMFDNGEYHPNKPLYNIGDVLQFECWSGFELKGSVNRTCQVNGKWSGKTAICEDNGGYCPNPGVPIGTTKTGISYGVENKVFYKCSQGFDMFGSSVRECTEDKYWSGTEPSCREWYTFDTPEEVAEMFSATLAANIEAADPDKEGKDISKRKLHVKKVYPMNIFIILDASKSVKEEDFNTAKQSSITFIEKVSSFDIEPRYAIISYASEAIPVVRLSDEESVEADKVIEKLYEFKYGAHGDMKGTNTRSAFRSLYEMLVLQELREKAQFMKIRNVILLLTDGKYNMGGDPKVELEKIKLFLEIGKSREDFLDVYVFGLGDGTDNNELNVLSSKKPNEQHTFRLQNIDHMKKAFDSIIGTNNIDTSAKSFISMSNQSTQGDDLSVASTPLRSGSQRRTDPPSPASSYRSWTIPKITSELKRRNIPFPATARKAELFRLLNITDDNERPGPSTVFNVQNSLAELHNMMTSLVSSVATINNRLDNLEANSITTVPEVPVPATEPTPNLGKDNPLPTSRATNIINPIHLIPQSLRRDIIEGKDVNLASLLIASQDVVENRAYTFEDLSVVMKSRDPRLNRKLNIPEFVLAFGLYRDVICTTFPLRREELDLYLHKVIELAYKYGGYAFYDYHKSFSSRSAASLSQYNTITDWAQLDTELFLMHFAGLKTPSCAICSSAAHSVNFCPENVATPSTSNANSGYQSNTSQREVKDKLGFTNGFHTGFVSLPTGVLECPNLQSALTDPDSICELLHKEISNGFMIGPFSTPPFTSWRTNPLGIATGKYNNKKRLIIDFSAPHSSPTPSLNALIPSEDFSLQYARIDDAIQAIIHAGRAAWLNNTPEEVAEMFSATLAANIEAADPDKKGEDISKRKLRIKKGDPMNIFIILDASKSVKKEDFNTAKESSITFIEKVSSFDIKPRYAIISYASEAIPVVRLSDEESLEADKVIDKLDEFKYGAHGDMKGTNTRSAFRSLYEMLVLQELREKAQFMKTRNVILLFTDGKYNMGGHPKVELDKIKLFLEIGKPREDFLDVYVFGLGDGTHNNELNVLASKKPNEQHTFRLQNIDHMKKAFDSIIGETDAMDMCGLNKEIIDDVFNNPNTDENKKKTLVNEKFPWIAKITITRPGSQETCKGSILTKNFILTAAHCFHFDEETKHINVQVGTESLPVKNLYRHPQFDRNAKKDKNINSTFDYDVALLELGRKISYSSTARPICIPCTKSSSWALRMKGEHITCKDHKDFLFKEEQIKSLFIAEEDKKLMEQKDVTIKSGNTRLACLRATEQVKEFKDIADIRDMVTDQFLCTGGTDPHVEPPTCKGDSGGPLIIEYKKRYIQVGIISWGSVNHCIGTKRKTTPVPELSRDFHISILSMLPWIEKTVTEELTYLPK
ncbi:uncharacterized protein LOC134573609 [Pelobates fuscus]|uniref:uncharacterized protein LOC134573609 n=1 Tax=Pelobates fuscus TaxID=191477 RepID=UPI002FE49F69